MTRDIIIGVWRSEALCIMLALAIVLALLVWAVWPKRVEP
jgi:hypothetical protein